MSTNSRANRCEPIQEPTVVTDRSNIGENNLLQANGDFRQFAGTHTACRVVQSVTALTRTCLPRTTNANRRRTVQPLTLYWVSRSRTNTLSLVDTSFCLKTRPFGHAAGWSVHPDTPSLTCSPIRHCFCERLYRQPLPFWVVECIIYASNRQPSLCACARLLHNCILELFTQGFSRTGHVPHVLDKYASISVC
mgnify:CR=1 FL=1